MHRFVTFVSKYVRMYVCTYVCMLFRRPITDFQSFYVFGSFDTVLGYFVLYVPRYENVYGVIITNFSGGCRFSEINCVVIINQCYDPCFS
jgi:hypothetical protein